MRPVAARSVTEGRAPGTHRHHSGDDVADNNPGWAVGPSLCERLQAEWTLAPAGYRNAEQEGDEQTGERGFARDRCDGGQGRAGTSCLFNRDAQPIDRCAQCARDLAQCAGDIGCGIQGAFGNAGLQIGLEWFGAHDGAFRA